MAMSLARHALRRFASDGSRTRTSVGQTDTLSRAASADGTMAVKLIGGPEADRPAVS
jgi:hypothetical protein